MKLIINDKTYNLQNIDLNTIPSYRITFGIAEDKRDLAFTDIEDLNKCVYKMQLYQFIYLYALQHNKEFVNDCYIIQLNNECQAKIIKKNINDYMGMFDVKFSSYDIALDCIKQIDIYLEGRN